MNSFSTGSDSCPDVRWYDNDKELDTEVLIGDVLLSWGGSFLSLLTKIGPKIIKKAIPVAAGLGVKTITPAVGKGVSSRRR